LTAFRHPDTHPWNETAHTALNNAFASLAPAHVTGRLLDVGCGLKPYGAMFAPYVTEHVGVDHPDSPHSAAHVDVSATAYDIPLPDATFDTVLLSEVLEHLEEPEAALRECFRLLKPGGKILLSAPMVWTLHEEPRDFYRFTPHGLRHLLHSAGFSVIEVVPLGGQWLTLGLMFGYAVGQTPLRRWPRVVSATQLASQRLGAWLNERNYCPWLSHGHVAVAQRRV
jgi:ubiquinone/menaquinone biosynthesis C-methylase UbiE